MVGCGGSNETDYEELTVKEIIETLADGRYEIEEITENNNNYKVVFKTDIMSGKTARKELLLKTKDTLKKLEGKDIEYINIEWQTELVDKLGNSEYNPVMRLDFKKKKH